MIYNMDSRKFMQLTGYGRKQWEIRDIHKLAAEWVADDPSGRRTTAPWYFFGNGKSIFL